MVIYVDFLAEFAFATKIEFWLEKTWPVQLTKIFTKYEHVAVFIKAAFFPDKIAEPRNIKWLACFTQQLESLHKLEQTNSCNPS